VTTVLGILLGVLVVLVITAFTGYFVAQEFGFMAVDRSRLKARAAAGDASARRALTITKRTSFMLSGAQLGITITGLIVGYVAEPLIGDGIGELLGGAGVSAGAGVAVGTVFALLFATVVQMVFGELFPDNPARDMTLHRPGQHPPRTPRPPPIQQVAQADLRPIDIARMGVQTYDITHYQPILFCGDDFGQVEDVVGGFFAEVDDDQVQRLAREITTPA
jgi:Cyclin M transmembrane N-terminal domain